MKLPDSTTIWIILAFGSTYIIWGSTYLALAWAVEDIPPFLMAGTRCLASSMILFSLVIITKNNRRVSRKQFKNAFFAGFMFLTLGMGSVSWALQYVDSGFTALLISGQPLVVVLIMWLVQGKQPSSQAFLGIALGMIGMYLLVGQDEIIVEPNQWFGVVVILLSLLSWGYASVFVSKADLPQSKMFNNSIQMLAGGISLLVWSLLASEPSSFQWSNVGLKAWLALAYLILFGMVIGFSAFNYLLSKVSPEKVATSTYVNPIIALILGWWLRDELITNQSVVAAFIMLTGVFFINSRRNYFKSRSVKLEGRSQ